MTEKKLPSKFVVNPFNKTGTFHSATGRNYITKHWYGEYSLTISYWINYIAVGVLFQILLNKYPEELLISTLHELYIYITIYCIVLFMVIWQIVGVWRSADNHIRKTKRKFWAYAAKALVVFGILGISFMVKDLLPGLDNFTYIFAEDIDVPSYSIRVTGNYKEIEITGGIKFGLTKSLRKYLNKYPAVKVIHLNSFGGRVVEARMLRELIKDKGLVTSTNKGCLSACTIAYMGGVSRFVYGERKLGFHRYGLADNHSDYIKKTVMESFKEDKAFFLNKGTSVNFINHIYNTSSADMWFPENDVLLANRIITDIADEKDFLLYQEKSADMHDIKNVSSNTPVYPAIKFDPKSDKKHI